MIDWNGSMLTFSSFCFNAVIPVASVSVCWFLVFLIQLLWLWSCKLLTKLFVKVGLWSCRLWIKLLVKFGFLCMFL